MKDFPTDKWLMALSFMVGFFPPLSIAGAWAAQSLWALAILWRAVKEPSTFRPRWNPVMGPLFFVWGAWLVASLASADPLKNLGAYPTQLRAVVFFLLVWADEGRWIPSTLTGYLFGAGLAALYGLAQAGLAWVVPPSVFQDWPARLRDYVTLHAGRAHGAVHPLTYAEVLLPALCLWGADYLRTEGRRRWLALGLLSLTGFSLLLSQSRGPWLGAAAGLALLFVIHPRRFRLLIPLAVAFVLLVATPIFRGRALSLANHEQDSSSTSRLQLWKSGWYVYQKHPFWGVGPKGLREAMDHYRPNPDFPPSPKELANDVHSQYLQHLVTRGPLGLMALLTLLATLIHLAWRWARETSLLQRTLPVGLAAFFFSYFVVNLTERAFDDGEVALLFWILAAVVVKRTQILDLFFGG